MADDWQQRIIKFWFEELESADWWKKNPVIDDRITERFGALWEKHKSKPAEDFLESPVEALAAIILFDQFPRNMFRENAKAYSSDPLAQQIAELTVTHGFDQQLSKVQRPFSYMPFMHAEDLRLQEMSVELFEKLGSNQKFAEDHHAAIAEFGRFPHRNTLLGRVSSEEELQAIADGAQW